MKGPSSFFWVSAILSILLLMVVSHIAKADYLFSTTVKYGPNGYEADDVSTSSSSSSSSTSKKRRFKRGNASTTTSSSTDMDLEVGDRIQAVIGFRLQTIPDSKGGLSFGVGYYLDNTAEASLGIRF